MGHFDIPDDVEIDTETSSSGEVEDGIGFVCNQCNTFYYSPSEKEIGEQYRRHADSGNTKPHMVGDYKSAYVENGVVKKL